MANEVKIIITGDSAQAVGESSSLVSRIKKHSGKRSYLV